MKLSSPSSGSPPSASSALGRNLEHACQAGETNASGQIPDSLIDILVERALYEEGVIRKLKDAYDRGEHGILVELVGDLLYRGPGTPKFEHELEVDSLDIPR